MSSGRISDKVAAAVLERARGICEYCGIRIDDTYFGGEIDHIRSRKHGGADEILNLALACQPCNRAKGTDLASIDDLTQKLTPLFNPRTKSWSDHFALEQTGEIIPLTDVGRVTVTLLRLNTEERMDERRGLLELGRLKSSV